MKNDILIRYLQKLNKAKFTQEELDLLEKEEKSE